MVFFLVVPVSIISLRMIHFWLLQFIGACKDPLMVIVTELLPGMSLRKYLISIRPNLLDLHVAINFALDIARAMDCLHANGIIHRDLKPGTSQEYGALID
jgi:serine/threonine protein kinase